MRGYGRQPRIGLPFLSFSTESDAGIHFYRPATPLERLYATIEERKSGRRVGVYLVELKDPKKRLIADAMFTVIYAEEESRC